MLLPISHFLTQSKLTAPPIGGLFSAMGMECLLDLEIVGSRIGIFGEEKGILSITIEHKSSVKYYYCMRRGFF